MTERELTAALDVLADRCEGEYGDWSDVLRRARVTVEPAIAGDGSRSATRARRRGRRARRIGFVALAAVVLVAVAFVSTGFGRDALRSLFGRIDVEFGTSERAPEVVRWRFEDLAIGAPPRVAPQAIASQARTVGTLRLGGRERTLWVAPTRRGGFCFQLEESFGGCMRDSAPAAGPQPPRTLPRVSAGPVITIDRRPNAPSYARMLGVQGVVLSEAIERLTIEFADGESEDLDFVYVSAPIDAGFFGYTVPEERQRGPGRPRFIVGRNGAGEVVARQRLPFPTRPPAVAPGRSRGPAYRTLPARPTPPPSTPLQRGEAHGVSVTAGRNGSVLFDATRIAPARRALLDGGITYGCFELVTRGGVTQDRGLGQGGRFQPTVGFRLFGIGTPLAGCEIQGGYGHRWPDKLGGHSAIEIPFTEAGSRFFANRAAARDLAVFLRTGAMRRMRREPTAVFGSWLRDRFGSSVVELPSRSSAPPKGKIGYWVGREEVVFRRVAATGRTFVVIVGEEGGIASENVRPLAFVF